MKQILSRTLLLLVVIAAILGLSSCKIFVEPEPSTYDLEVDKFERNVVYGSELDLSGLRIKVTTGTDVEYVPVTDDMVTGGDTLTVGEQELVVEYGGLSFPLYYEVFYKVEHIVDGFVYDSQLVTSRDELMRVSDPKKEGYTFIGWDLSIPNELTGNLRINAMFADVVVPDFSATYGDTLADLTLPEAKEGHWEWKDSLSTPVGNAGTNKFILVYIPNNPAADKLEFQVPVVVAKKKVEITVIRDTFEYDGNEHAVEYVLSDGLTASEVNLLCFGTEYATEHGSYYYNLRIFGNNYEGQVTGYLEITKPVWYVSVLLQDPADSQFKDSVTINYGEAFPEYRVDIVDKNGNPVNVESLGIKVVVNKPNMLVALGYDIVASLVDATDDGVDDLKHYDIIYSSAKFVVNKVDFNPGEPVFADNETIYYGDLLSSVKFAEHPNGEWSWDYEYAGGDTVGNAGKNSFKAIFTPRDSNYNSYEAYVVLDVQKQILYFDVDPVSTNVDYDGEEHRLSFVIRDANGKIIEGLTVTGEISKSNVNLDKDGNAIAWPVTLEILDNNYIQSADNQFYLMINRIDPVTDFETPHEIVWRPGLTLADVALPDDNYSWEIDTSYELDKAGTYIIKAKYTPDDTTNYNVIIDDMTIVVSLANTAINGVEPSYDHWKYDGEKKDLIDIFGGLTTSGNNRTVEYRMNGEKVENLTDAGVYNITIVVVGTEQYEEATFDVVVTIQRANAEIYTAGIEGWTYLTYDESVNSPYSTSNYGTVIYEYKLISEDDSAYTTVVPVNAGSYRLRARIEGGEGYNWNASEHKYYDFTIAKAVVSLPEIESKPYTGETLIADVPAHDLYRVKENGNLGGINVDDYDVVLVLDDASNYVWSNNAPTGETTVTFKIVQADNSVYEFDGGEWIYGDTVSHTDINAVFGKETVTIKYYKDLGNGVKGDEVPVVSAAGDYIVRAEIGATANYKGAYREVAFTVEKLKIAVPALEETQLEYIGSNITATVVDPETEYYWITNDGGTGVNTYYVHLDLKNDNYIWDDGDENARKSLEYSIFKSLVTVETVTIEGWTFNDKASAPSATKDKTFGTLKYEYKLYGADDSTYTTTVPTAAGRYVLRAGIVDNNNYDSISKTVEFVIDKDSASIEGVRSDRVYTTVYNNKSYTISNVTSSHDESSVTYSVNGKFGEEMKNAGTYKVVFFLDESDNYYAAEPIEVTVVISKFAVNVPELESDEMTYNGSEFEPDIKANVHSSYFEVSYPEAEHKNAGSYAVEFTIKDTLNYEWNDSTFTGSIPYEIKKENASISIETEGKDYLTKNEDGTYTLTLTYSGTEFNLKSLIGATRIGEAGVEYSISGATNVADSGVVTVSVGDSTNYNGTSVDVNVVINPANINSASIHFGTALTYTGSEQTQSISAVKLGDIDVTYIVSGTSDKATTAGSHTVTVKGTGNFTGEATATFTIAAKSIADATVTLGDALIYTGSVQYQTVSSVALEGFENVTYTVSGNEATYAVDANGTVITYTLTVKGTGNFTGETTKTFTVERRSIADANVTLGTSLTYTGKEQYQAVSSVKVGDLAATYSVSGNEATYAVDANGTVITYTLTVKGTGNFTGETTKSFTVARRSIAGATVTLGTALTYNGEEQTQTVSSVTMAGYNGITYKVTDNVATYAVDVHGNTINYILVVEGTGNFTGTTTKSFSVGKLELDKPQDNVQIKWTGEHLTYGLEDTDYYKVDDIGGIDENDYVAIFTITDRNCKWKGEADTTLEIKINYAIAKEINHWTVEPTISKNLWTFNDDVATVDKGAADQGEVTYKFAPEGTTDYVEDMPTKPGKYYVVFTATKEGYKDLTKTIPFEIKKDTLITPEFVDDTLDYANNSVPELTLKANEDADKFTFTNNVEYNVGDYSIVFTIKPEYVDYYKWENTDSTTLSVHYSIVRVDEEITDLDIRGWTYLEYNEELNAPTANKKFKDSKIIFEYKLAIEDETKYTTTVPTAVGDYVVRARIEGGEGYNWNGTYATKTFSITAADASISIDTEGKDYLTKNEDGTYTLTLTYTSEVFDLVSLIGATRVGEAKVEYSVSKVQNVADSCTLTISVADSANYNGTSVDVQVVINPANIAGATVTLGTPLTYTGSEQYQKVASVTLGTLTVTHEVLDNAATYVVDENGKVITYTLTVKGTGNFTGTENATFHVLPKSIAGAEVTLGNTLTYNGGVQNQTVSSVTLAGFGNVTYTVTEDSDLAVENADDYAITVVGTGNFAGSVTKTFSVAPLDIKNASVTLSLGAAPDYNGADQTQSVASIVVNGIKLTEDDYYVADGDLTAKVVGDYNVTVRGQGNFTGSVIVAWSIETLYLDMPYYDTTTKYTYDGETEHVFFSETNTFWEATGDLKGLEAGDYYVTIAIKAEHADYCEWKENVSRRYKYTVDKGTNEFVGTLTMGGWTYEDTEIGTPTGITGAKFGFENITYIYYDQDGNLLDADPTSTSKIGTYKVYAHIPGDGKNYDDITTTYDVTFAISPKEIDVPKINSVQNYVKGGDNYPTILGTTTVLTAGDHGDYTVTYNNFPETLALTTYYVNVKLNNANYVWSDTKDNRVYNLSYTLKGENAKIEITDEDGVIEGWTYDEAPEDIVAHVKDKLGLKISISSGIVTDYQMSILYFESKDSSAVGSTVVPTNAGTYYFKIVIEKDDDNYERTVSEAFYQFTITSKDLTAPEMTTISAIYGDTLGKHTITDVVKIGDKEIAGTWTWVDGFDESVGIVGTRTFKATFTPDAKQYGTNYAPITNVDVTVVVTAKEITLDVTQKNKEMSYIADGYTISDIFTFVFKDGNTELSLTSGEDYTITITDKNGIEVDNFTSAGKYTVTISLDNDNYVLKQGVITEYEFTVKTAKLTLEGAVENNTSKPYGGEYHNKTADFFKSGLTLKDVNGNTVTGLTINVAIYLDADCTISTDSISDAKNYYIKYTLAENDNYTMDAVDRTVKVTAADIGEISWPAYATDVKYTYKTFVSKDNFTVTERDDGTFTISDPDYKSNAGYATFTIIFNPNSSNYTQKTYEHKVPLKAVAEYNNVDYYSIKEALDAASSGTVWVYPDTTGYVIIDDNTTIKQGVTLVLPYAEYTGQDDSSVRNQKNKSGYYEATLQSTAEYVWNEDSRRVTLVILDGATLIIKGTLDIAGELSGKTSSNSYAGHTAGKYSELKMINGATINCDGTITAFGFITDSGNDNNVYVSGAVYQPFVLLDFLGGSYMYGMYNDLMESYGLAPFQEFALMNIHPKVTYYHNSQLYGCANLYANDQHNPTTSSIIGNSSSSLLQTVTNGYIVSDYDPLTEVTDLDVYGGATLNSLSLKVNAGITVTISTSSVYFPMSWLYDISLNPTDSQKESGTIAEYTINQKVQILWGSKFVVEQGSKLTVNSDMIIHDGEYFFTYVGAAQLYGDNKHTETPTVIVNGELIANSVTGKIYSEVNGAKITARNKISTPIYNASVTGSSFLASGTAIKVYNSELRLLYGENKSLSMLGASGITMTYVLNDTMNAWIGDYVYIAFDPNGGEYTGIGRIQVEINKDELTYKTPVINVTDPTREYYTFGGWYLDRECTIPYGDGATRNITDMTVYIYAKWIPKAYNVEYQYKSDTSASLPVGLPTPEGLSEITVETPGTLPYPNNVGGWYFLGWYLDAEFTQKVVAYADITKVDGSATQIYGRWTDVPTYVVEITNPEYPNGNESGLQHNINVSVQDYANGNLEMFEAQFLNDYSKSYYITGWINNATGLVVTNWNEVVTENDFGTVYSITPIWSAKYIVTITGNNGVADPNALSINGFTGFGTVEYIDTVYTGGFYTVEQIKSLLGNGSTNYAYATKYDTNTGVSKYFVGWKVDDVIYSDIANIPTEYYAGSRIAVEAVWDTKYKLVVASTGSLQFADTIWLTEGQIDNSYLLEYETNTNHEHYVKKYDNDLGQNKYFGGWDCTNISKDKFENKVLTVNVNWSDKVTVSVVHTHVDLSIGNDAVYTFYISSNGADSGQYYSVKKTGNSSTNASLTVYIMPGHYIKFNVEKSSENSNMPTGWTRVTANYTANIKSSTKLCVTGDTLITLADGSQKRIDEITSSDILKVWNFYEGAYAYVPAAVIYDHGYGNNTIIKLTFSDGTITKAINVHGYYDATLNEFVMINAINATEFIGHEFVKEDGQSYTTVTLTNVEVSYEYIQSYSILSALYYNFITDSMFSLTYPDYHENYFMPFEVDENMKYDEEKMAEDIATYGLYEYSDFEDVISYEVFEGLNIKYQKVAVAKGLITYEELCRILYQQVLNPS